MKKIAIVSSKKYIRSKQFKNLTKTLDSQKIEYEYIDLGKDEDHNNLTQDSVVLGLGGDGTALRAMKLGWIHHIPVLNIGSGRIGYLVNSIEEIDITTLLTKSNKKYLKSRRPIIQNGNVNSPAFNEIVIIKNSPTRLLDLEIETYDQKVKLRADGIIISTSLGSTAYNYSAGGPIVQTSIDTLIITPISPFTKFPRSIVLDKKSAINVMVAKNQNYSIQFDGIENNSSISNKDECYQYLLSADTLDVFHEKDIPKLDLFLNQILR